MQTTTQPSNKVSQNTEKPIFKVAKLVMVTAINNNKFYEMEQVSEDRFTVTYGRVGNRGAISEYSIYQWESKYREKIRKGYKDVTHLFAEEITQNKKQDGETSDSVVSWSAIKNGEVRELFRLLTSYAKRSIGQNYEVKSSQVTMAQVEKAQSILDDLSKKVDFNSNTITKKGLQNFDTVSFNTLLLELYGTIPRRMEAVQNYLLEYSVGKKRTKKILLRAREILKNEQETLDVMRGEVEIRLQEVQKNSKVSKSKKSPTSTQTLLENLGIEVRPLSEKSPADSLQIKKVKKMMQEEVGKFVKLYAVKDIVQEKVFNQNLKESKYRSTRLLWHGSRNENWLSILKTGLVLRPTNAIITGKMFGYGLYFADKCRKSLNYTSLRGSHWTAGNDNHAFLAIYEVHTGKQLKIESYQNWCAALSYQNLKKQNKEADSLFAKGGIDLLNNEYIVYKENQCTVRYLVEVQY